MFTSAYSSAPRETARCILLVWRDYKWAYMRGRVTLKRTDLDGSRMTFDDVPELRQAATNTRNTRRTRRRSTRQVSLALSRRSRARASAPASARRARVENLKRILFTTIIISSSSYDFSVGDRGAGGRRVSSTDEKRWEVLYLVFSCKTSMC